MKIIIYVLCYNEETMQSAIKEYGNHEWARITCIETTPLMENIMYDKVLLEHYDEWKDAEYVGTISWKTSKKILLPDMQKLKQFLKQAPYDIIPFYITNENMIDQANYYHPKFKSLWCKWLTALHVEENDILNPTVPAFFSNYWITTPTLMLKYIEYFKIAKTVLDKSPEVQAEVWEDSTYDHVTLSKEKCMQIYGKPYFPYHVFLYERLPCFFFWKNNASIFNPNMLLWLYKY